MSNSINDLQNHKENVFFTSFKYILIIGLSVISIYILIILFFTLLVKEEDKSLKNIFTKINEFLSIIVTQISFLIISFFFAALISFPLVYIAQNKGNIFANIVTIIIALFLLYLYLKRVITIYINEKRISCMISSMFPAWFKIIFWILFTLYFVPFAIGMARINVLLGILIFFAAIILINVLFYADKVVNYIKSKKQAKQA
jgi:hypothetical protein